MVIKKPFLSKFAVYKTIWLPTVAILYFLSARIGFLFAFENTNVIPVWIPSGLAFSLILIVGNRIWPGIFLGAFVTNLTIFLSYYTVPIPSLIFASAIIALGSVSEAFVGSYLVKRYLGSTLFLDKYQGIFKLIEIIILMSIISSIIGATIICLLAISNWNLYGTIWMTMFFGNFLGILVITPLISSWYLRQRVKLKFHRVIEQILVFFFLAYFAEAIFVRNFSLGNISTRMYMLVPFLLWVVLRFNFRETTTAVALVSAIAVWGTVHGKGPFVFGTFNEMLIQLSAFITVITVTFMSLSAILAESKRTMTELKNHKRDLEKKIDERTQVIEKINLKLLKEIMAKENAENFLKNKTNKLDEAQRIAQLGNWEWNMKTGERIWSEEQYRIFGYEPFQTITKNHFVNLLHPDDKVLVIASINEALQGKNEFDIEYRIIRPDGLIRNIDAKGKVYRNLQGIPEKMIGTTQDITLKKEAQEKIMNLSEFQKIIINGTAYSIISTDDKGIITTFNKGAELMLGYKAEEMIGICSPAVIHDYNEIVNRAKVLSQELSTKIEPGFEAFVAKSRRGEPDVNEWSYIRKDGSRLTVELSVTTLRNFKNGITGYLGIAKDITEQNLITKQLHKAKQFAEESSRLKEMFLANMSHEIRTPMNAIVGFTSLLTETVLNEMQDDLVSNINHASQNLLAIINNILDLSKIESGLMQIEKKVVHLPALLESIHSVVLGNALEKNLEISLSINPKIPDYVICDPTRLSQILINLTTNAIKFTEKGFVNIRAELLHNDNQKLKIKFIVKDSGIGIAKENQDIIFDRFIQESVETSRKYGGTGLGLSIVKNIIKLLDGELKVESELGMGTEFTVIIPFDICSVEEIELFKELKIKPENENLIPENLNVLLVEDNRMNQHYVNLILGQQNIQCAIAGNGKEALQKMKDQNFDLILMDIQMPELDGNETASIIRHELNNSVPIIGLTASAMADEKVNSLMKGMDDYLSKPFKPKDLINKINEIFRNKDISNKIISRTNDKTPWKSLERTIDLNLFYEKVNEKSMIMKELIEIFELDTPHDIERLEVAIRKNDLMQIEIIAHQLISSFGILGIEPAVALLKSMEMHALNNHEIILIENLFSQFIKINDMVKLKIQELNLNNKMSLTYTKTI